METILIGYLVIFGVIMGVFGIACLVALAKAPYGKK